jgi:hypothetical protein
MFLHTKQLRGATAGQPPGMVRARLFPQVLLPQVPVPARR